MTMMHTLAQNVVSRDYWFGSPGNTAETASTDALFMFILWVSIVSFVLLMVPMFWWAFKYRRSAQASNYQMSPSHNTVLELGWTIGPLLILIPIFFWGFTGYINKQAAPADAEEIMIRGQKWNWTATYPNSGMSGLETVYVTGAKYSVPVIYVPAGRPVKLVMTSSDVLHSFYIPAFRLKMDVFPNRYTSMWFQATEETTDDANAQDGRKTAVSADKGKEGQPIDGHVVYCAEYCGDSHSEMAALIRVVSPDIYKLKKQEATEVPEGPIAEMGPALWKFYGCNACHSIDGKANTGPTWKGSWGTQVPLEDGTTVLFDANYARESIYQPRAKMHKGYPPQMPIYQGVVKEEHLEKFILYFRYLAGENVDAPVTEGTGEATPAEAPPAPPAAAPVGH